MSVTVWSEQNELYAASYVDCAYAAALTMLVAAGKTSYPLGIYTPQEREALERSDYRANETGGSVVDITTAIANRYKINIHLPDASTLVGLLGKPGRAIALFGYYGNLSPWLRRWSPYFYGGHMVCVLTGLNGTHRWLDPLAPNGFAGEWVSTATVTRFTGGTFDARWMRVGELIKPEEFMIATATITAYNPPKVVSIPKGKTVHGYRLDKEGPVKTQAWPNGSSMHSKGLGAVVQSPNPARTPHGTFHLIADGFYAGLYVPAGEVK